MDDQEQYATFICCISLDSICTLEGSFIYGARLEKIKPKYQADIAF